jgi:uncharacterized membrane protein
MVTMQPKVFLNQLDDRRILEAIAAAEARSSGQIRVYVSEKQVEDVISEAKVHFLRLGMEKTRARNAVLIYIAPRSQNFAVIGDVGIHERGGDNLWQGVAGEMEVYLRQERFTEAVISAIAKVGAVLASHFPPDLGGTNELPDAVVRD